MGCRRQVTCWVRSDQEQRFLGTLDCYVEALQRLGLLVEAPTCEREAGASGLRLTFVLRWVDADAPERSLTHGVVRTALRQLTSACQRMRLVGSPAPWGETDPRLEAPPEPWLVGSDVQPLLT